MHSGPPRRSRSAEPYEAPATPVPHHRAPRPSAHVAHAVHGPADSHLPSGPSNLQPVSPGPSPRPHPDPAGVAAPGHSTWVERDRAALGVFAIRAATAGSHPVIPTAGGAFEPRRVQAALLTALDEPLPTALE